MKGNADLLESVRKERICKSKHRWKREALPNTRVVALPFASLALPFGSLCLRPSSAQACKPRLPEAMAGLLRSTFSIL